MKTLSDRTITVRAKLADAIQRDNTHTDTSASTDLNRLRSELQPLVNICKKCHDSKVIAFFYDRPDSPPGNQMIPCPDCPPAESADEARIIIDAMEGRR